MRNENLAELPALISHFSLIEIAFVSERKISRPSFDPKSSSQARSGCGIIPKTFPSLLQIPAIFEREPFGLASSVVSPVSSQ